MQDWLFRALLRLLPEEFRAAYARDMEATFRADCSEARARGSRRTLAGLWLSTIGDLVRTAPGEHIDILRRDLRFALRMMAARPLHTVTAVATLAIGIGANVAMFAVVDAVLLRPLPYRDPAQLVMVAQTESGVEPANLGYMTFVDLQERSRSFATLVAATVSTATITEGPLDPERVNAMRVSRDYFDMLGVSPALGRTFTDAEDRPGSARRVVILSDGLWRRRFRGDPGMVGATIDLGGLDHRIVGVLPPAFDDLVAARLYGDAEVWYPLGYDPAAPFACRTCQHLRVFGRLAPGADPASAERELNAIFANLEREHPTQYHAAGSQVTRLSDVFLGPVRPVLLVLMAGVAVLLLVACVNVANLLLLRASERSREMAVRAAMGVTPSRLARQLLTESVLVGLIGGLAGLVLAWAAVRLLAVTGPSQIPRLADVAIDVRAAAVASALTLASGVIFGLVPLTGVLRRTRGVGPAGASRHIGSAAIWRVRAGLVAGNVAMAALLLVGSGLLVRSLAGLLAVVPGFDPSNVLTTQIWASGAAFREGGSEEQISAAVRFYDEVLSRARALPGVAAAAAVTTLPLGGEVDAYGFHIRGRVLANPEEAPMADRFVITSGFFAALRIPLVRGRLLDERDALGAEPVIVINRTAEALFPGEDAIGRQVSLGPPNAEPRTIVGVVGDVRHHGLDRAVGYQVYVPQAQWAWAETFMTLVLRSGPNAMSLAQPVREVVRTIDPAQAVTNMRLYEHIIAGSTATRRFAAGLLTAFAGVAVLLAVVGLYGALGVMVQQRRREIGVRIALGARAHKVRRMVLGQGMQPVGVGLATGLSLAAMSAGTLRSLLYEVDVLDPLTFATAATLIVTFAAGACLLPAWRAANIDPAATLRE